MKFIASIAATSALKVQHKSAHGLKTKSTGPDAELIDLKLSNTDWDDLLVQTKVSQYCGVYDDECFCSSVAANDDEYEECMNWFS